MDDSLGVAVASNYQTAGFDLRVHDTRRLQDCGAAERITSCHVAHSTAFITQSNLVPHGLCKQASCPLSAVFHLQSIETDN